MTFGARERCAAVRREPHGTHRRTHGYTWKPAQCERRSFVPAAYSCIWEVNTRVDSRPWPVIGVALGSLISFFFFFSLLSYLCFENTKPKN